MGERTAFLLLMCAACSSSASAAGVANDDAGESTSEAAPSAIADGHIPAVDGKSAPDDEVDAGDVAHELDAGGDIAELDAGREGCVVQTFYWDGDGDGFGGTITRQACEPPAPIADAGDSGASWVTIGGDCADNSRDAHPGQTTSFTAPIVTDQVIDGGTVESLSWDYDCDGHETETIVPPALHAPKPPYGECTYVIRNGSTPDCDGSGYVPHVDDTSNACGSNGYILCSWTGSTCVKSLTGAPALACR